MPKTKIEWTEETWNPIRGCSMAKGSETGGCLNCYAARMAARGCYPVDSRGNPFAKFLPSGPRWSGQVELVGSQLDIPMKRRKPTTFFVNSMSDLFHEGLRDSDISQVFWVMKHCPQHRFQVLTKRSERMLDAFETFLGDEPSPNIWLGVSVESRKNLDRIERLRQVPAAVRFLSLEPLLENLGQLDLSEIDWVIVGGESGPGARPMNPFWVRSIRDQCQAAGVPFFLKQWGEWAPDCLCGRKLVCRTIERPQPGRRGCMFHCGKRFAGCELDGREWRELPKVIHATRLP